MNTTLTLDAGPNMAGKSTIMRSTIAVALLGSCGLFGPARAAGVPYIDAFMLRTFSADAPTEGRSSFAVEMVEMRCAPTPASPHLLPWAPGPFMTISASPYVSGLGQPLPIKRNHDGWWWMQANEHAAQGDVSEAWLGLQRGHALPC